MYMYIGTAGERGNFRLNLFSGSQHPPSLQMIFDICFYSSFRSNICIVLYFTLKLHYANVNRETGY